LAIAALTSLAAADARRLWLLCPWSRSEQGLVSSAATVFCPRPGATFSAFQFLNLL